jgi:hypothetical protein
LNNLSVNGESLLGTRSNVEPDSHNWCEGNAFWNSTFRAGYQRPSQMQIRRNYFGNSTLSYEWMWADGETVYEEALELPSIIEENIFIPAPNQKHLALGVSHYDANGRQDGKGRFRTGDICNRNEFWNGFFTSLSVGGSFAASVTRLVDWQTWTLSRGGIKFDESSVVNVGMPANHLWGRPNEYDTSLIHAALFNWHDLATERIQIAANFKVYDAWCTNCCVRCWFSCH